MFTDYWNNEEMFRNNDYENNAGIKAASDYYNKLGQKNYNQAIGDMTSYTGGMLNSAASGAATSALADANLQYNMAMPGIVSQQRNDYLNYLQFGANRGDAEYGRYRDDASFAAQENQRKYDKNYNYGQLTGNMPSGMLDTGATVSGDLSTLDNRNSQEANPVG